MFDSPYAHVKTKRVNKLVIELEPWEADRLKQAVAEIYKSFRFGEDLPYTSDTILAIADLHEELRKTDG